MSRVISCIRSVAMALLLMLTAGQTMANIVITGTRVIYPSDEKEVTVKLENKGKGPVLIQAWIDDGDINATPDSLRVPFVISPPLNRVDPEKGQTLRISFTGKKNYQMIAKPCIGLMF